MRKINLQEQVGDLPELKDMLKMKGVRLRELGKGYEVYLCYDMSEDTTENAVFKLEIRGRDLDKPVDILLYKEQITRVLRAV